MKIESECVFCQEYLEWGEEYREHMQKHHVEFEKKR